MSIYWNLNDRNVFQHVWAQGNFLSVPCDPGQYFDSDSGCQDCLVDTYSGGEFVTSCTSCPSGKTVSSGSGTNIEDCEWSEFYIQYFQLEMFSITILWAYISFNSIYENGVC